MPVETRTTITIGRLRSIDALRGAAALGVVLYHAAGTIVLPASSSGIERWTIQPVQWFSSFGYTGVFLFFVISGFCIHLQWARVAATGATPQIHFLAFWKRRARRLYPPYLAALALYLIIAAFTSRVEFNAFYVWDVSLHLLMLHNLDARTVYSINGVFWTLAIEEQLYLAYFLLLFLRRRFGWARALLCCALVRVLWFACAPLLKSAFSYEVPLTESALSHWFTWALGALCVEAAVGLILLPAWCRKLRSAIIVLLAAVCLSYLLPLAGSSPVLHEFGLLLLHPLWGAGFFLLVCCAVNKEQSRQSNSPTLTDSTTPTNSQASRFIRWLAFIGVFSYSLYLTHQLVIMESYLFFVLRLPTTLTPLILTTPACLVFAWMFFRVCERPFLSSRAAKTITASIETTEATNKIESGASASSAPIANTK